MKRGGARYRPVRFPHWPWCPNLVCCAYHQEEVCKCQGPESTPQPNFLPCRISSKRSLLAAIYTDDWTSLEVDEEVFRHTPSENCHIRYRLSVVEVEDLPKARKAAPPPGRSREEGLFLVVAASTPVSHNRRRICIAGHRPVRSVALLPGCGAVRAIQGMAEAAPAFLDKAADALLAVAKISDETAVAALNLHRRLFQRQAKSFGQNPLLVPRNSSLQQILMFRMSTQEFSVSVQPMLQLFQSGFMAASKKGSMPFHTLLTASHDKSSLFSCRTRK